MFGVFDAVVSYGPFHHSDGSEFRVIVGYQDQTTWVYHSGEAVWSNIFLDIDKAANNFYCVSDRQLIPLLIGDLFVIFKEKEQKTAVIEYFILGYLDGEAYKIPTAFYIDGALDIQYSFSRGHFYSKTSGGWSLMKMQIPVASSLIDVEESSDEDSAVRLSVESEGKDPSSPQSRATYCCSFLRCCFRSIKENDVVLKMEGREQEHSVKEDSGKDESVRALSELKLVRIGALLRSIGNATILLEKANFITLPIPKLGGMGTDKISKNNFFGRELKTIFVSGEEGKVAICYANYHCSYPKYGFSVTICTEAGNEILITINDNKHVSFGLEEAGQLMNMVPLASRKWLFIFEEMVIEVNEDRIFSARMLQVIRTENLFQLSCEKQMQLASALPLSLGLIKHKILAVLDGLPSDEAKKAKKSLWGNSFIKVSSSLEDITSKVEDLISIVGLNFDLPGKSEQEKQRAKAYFGVAVLLWAHYALKGLSIEQYQLEDEIASHMLYKKFEEEFMALISNPIGLSKVDFFYGLEEGCEGGFIFSPAKENPDAEPTFTPEQKGQLKREWHCPTAE